MAVLERIKKDTLPREEKTLLEEWERSFIQLDEYRDYLENDLKPQIEEEARQKGLQKALQVLQEVRQEVRQEIEEEVHKELDLDKEKTVLLSFQEIFSLAIVASCFKPNSQNYFNLLLHKLRSHAFVCFQAIMNYIIHALLFVGIFLLSSISQKN